MNTVKIREPPMLAAFSNSSLNVKYMEEIRNEE